MFWGEDKAVKNEFWLLIKKEWILMLSDTVVLLASELKDSIRISKDMVFITVYGAYYNYNTGL